MWRRCSCHAQVGVVMGCGVRTVVLLVRLVSFAYRRQFAAVDVHGIFVQIQFEAGNLKFSLNIDEGKNVCVDCSAGFLAHGRFLEFYKHSGHEHGILTSVKRSWSATEETRVPAEKQSVAGGCAANRDGRRAALWPPIGPKSDGSALSADSFTRYAGG